MSSKKKKSASAFEQHGLKKTVDLLLEEIRDLYLSDQIPWVVGYSGGKDSTAILQLIWLALEGLEPEELKKPIHVISTDTLVENPVVAAWVTASLETIRIAAADKGLPFMPHRLTPKVTDTFWVNLIGKGYPAPRHMFRWCTERLKINPSNTFITGVVRESGEAILVLGTRKAESTIRAINMERHELKRTRERLSPNSRLPNSLVFTPIEDWSNDDVWIFLMQYRNPWGYDNKNLLTMYQGASPDGECPLVVDTTTPSCGDSRFGCWVCTLVDKDKSMQAMIQNDQEKEWMLPLLEFRNKLDFRDKGERSDRDLRDFRRMGGQVQLFHDDPIPGPYKQSAREEWLRLLLEAQAVIRKSDQPGVRDVELITLAELKEIRRIWVVDKHEFEDSLPRIYEEATGVPFPGEKFDDNLPFGEEEVRILKDVCGGEELHFELIRELLDIQRRYNTLSRRAGLYDDIEKAFKRSFYEGEEDAVSYAREKKDKMRLVHEARGHLATAEAKGRA
ncbi:MAG TPA: DNA phosphorothioation system sulfurtransferase DndC [Pyrinomonadaceae bacterium]|nr:DNA phosphorothioation system sulfurtransferase DndC [Pyrinomonadaceae bacterium]